MIRPTLISLCALALCACATCERHPTACTVGAALVAGSVAAAVQHHHDERASSAPHRDYFPVERGQ